MINQLNEIYADEKMRFALMQDWANKYDDFKIIKSWLENGYAKFAAWRSVIHCSEKKDLYKYTFSHRQILPFEVVLDMDEVELLPRAHELFNRLYDDGIITELYLFETGSKGVHIHIFLVDEYKKYANQPKIWRNEMKKVYKLIQYWGFDALKASSNVPIALEFAPHWKSGRQKRLLKGKGCMYESD